MYKEHHMLDQIKRKIVPLLQKNGIKKAGFFGSYARGEAEAESDVDILVEIDKDISLLDFVRLKLEIENGIGKKVDLVEYDTIKPLIRDKIIKEEMRIL